MNIADIERYQHAAQNVRMARRILSNLDDKSLGDHVILVALGLLEEVMSDRHEVTGDDE